MAEDRNDINLPSDGTDVDGLVRRVIDEYRQRDNANSEPAYKAELIEERKRREQLEKRVNELVEENQRSRRQAEELERIGAIRNELQHAGVQKVDLAYKAVQEDIVRTEDGRILGRSEAGAVPLREYIADFVQANPEFLPARITGGSGVGPGSRVAPSGSGVELEKIRPGMSREEMERARLEILRVASQTLKGQ